MVPSICYIGMPGRANRMPSVSFQVRVNSLTRTSAGIKCGAVAHLGERFNGIEEVRGSSPRSSTTSTPSMFYVYILCSERTGRYYIGSTNDVQSRVDQHNAGASKSTKSYRPWRLVHQEEYDSLPEARKRESLIKSWKNRSYLESQLHLNN